MIIKNPKPQITFLLSYSSIFHLGAWRNSIDLILKENYKVSLIQFSDVNLKTTNSNLEKKYNLILIPFPVFLKGLFFVIKISFRLLKKIGLNKICTFGDGLTYIISSFYFIVFTYFKINKNVKQVILTGDPPGNIAAYFLSKKTKSRIIFWPLELFLEKELHDWGMKFIKRIERKLSKNIDCVIEFGEMRARLIKDENMIDQGIPTFIIPNSRIGKPEIRRNFYFNDLFSIAKDKKIILYGGGIYGDTNNTNALLRSAYDWPENYILILHAKKKQDIANKINIDKNLAKGKIFIDDTPLTFDKIDIIYSSADIGLVLNAPSSKVYYSNHLYSQLSLGKLFHYAFNGVPIISQKLYGYKDLIEKSGIGLCIEKTNEIKCSIDKILSHEEKFKKNCLSFSHSYAFENYHKPFIEFLNKLI